MKNMTLTIEENLSAMTTDDYHWGNSHETHDRYGTYVKYCCEHENGWYEYTENIDKGRRTTECVSVDDAWFKRIFGERGKQWRGYTTRHIDYGYGYDETVQINVTDKMKTALDKISKIHSK